MAIVLRSVKGSNLTPAEVDGNFTTVEAMINAKAAQGVGIASATLIPPDQLQFQLTDHSYLPPIILPTATFGFRGAWTPSTPYLVNDIFSEGPNGYIVLVQHTSATTFDPHATDGSGHNLYGVLFAAPNVVPIGGAGGSVLTKHSSADYDAIWNLPTLAGLSDVDPTPPASGDFLRWNGHLWSYGTVGAGTLAGLSDVLASPAPTDGQVVYWSNSASAFTYKSVQLQTLSDVGLFYLNIGDILQVTQISPSITFASTCREPYTQQTSGSSYTLVIGDLWSLIDVTSSSAFTITVPPQSSVPWPSATINAAKIRVRQSNLAQVSIVGGSGVTVTATSGRLAKTRANGSIIELEKIGADNWVVSGDLALNSASHSSSVGSGAINMANDDGGDVYPVTPSGNITLTMSNPVYGRRVSVVVTTSGTTSFTITFSTGFKSTGTLATGTVTGKVFTVNFICDGTNLNETSRTTAM